MEKTTDKKTTKRQPPHIPIKRHHGNNLAFWRNFRGKTQQDLADMLEKSQQYISKLEESPKIDPEIIEILAKALEIDPQNITDWETDSSMNIFNIEKLGEGEGSTNMVGTYNFETNHEVHIHPIDKVCDIYEKWIADKNKESIEKDKLINILTNTLKENQELQKELLLELRHNRENRS